MSLERLEVTPFPLLLRDIIAGRKTGSLTVIRQPLRKIVYWSQGEIVLAISNLPEESLGEFLVVRGQIQAADAFLFAADDADVVLRFGQAALVEGPLRQTFLRDWLSAILLPLFSMSDGTAFFTEEAAIAPEKRIFVPSTAALVLDGVRSIFNGLVLRRSLGDLKRCIQPATGAAAAIESLPLSPAERRVAASLMEPETVESFLKRHASDPVAGKTVIAMTALGLFDVVMEKQPRAAAFDDMEAVQRDLALLASIGASDPRLLRIVALARQIGKMDFYEVLQLPRGCTRPQIALAFEQKKAELNPEKFPPALRDHLSTIHQRMSEAASVLTDPVRRGEYDRMLARPTVAEDADVQQKLVQKSIAEKNFAKARELSSEEDYYGAIVLLKQAVNFLPDFAEAWFLLGSCQERNPKWRREAVQSFQKALALTPNDTEVLLSLGDLYKMEGLATRAIACYEDVLKLEPDNPQAKSRLKGMKR